MKTQKPAARYGLVMGTIAALGTLVVSLGACVDPYPPAAPHQAYYRDGYYSYYDYPSDYRSAYSGDYEEYRARRDAEERNGMGHTDDRNFHNRDDYDHYDR